MLSWHLMSTCIERWHVLPPSPPFTSFEAICMIYHLPPKLRVAGTQVTVP